MSKGEVITEQRKRLAEQHDIISKSRYTIDKLELECNENKLYGRYLTIEGDKLKAKFPNMTADDVTNTLSARREELIEDKQAKLELEYKENKCYARYMSIEGDNLKSEFPNMTADDVVNTLMARWDALDAHEQTKY